MPEKNRIGGSFPLEQGKPKAEDPTTDFTRALAAANNTESEAPEAVGLPAIFPESHEAIEERVHEEVPPPEEKGVEFTAEAFVARYRRFDLADPIDTADLEKINNHIMHDGWLPSREEWIHTRDGGTYVVLKWLERVKPLKKKTAASENPEDILKGYGIGVG